eukprot:6491357-Amphidinium_carterae.1
MKDASMSNANAGLTLEEVMPTETVDQDEKKTSQSSLAKEVFLGVKGILLLLTDDLLEAGASEHRDAVGKLITTYKTGRRNSLKDRGGGVFNGRRVCQTAEGGFTVSMHDYVAEKLKPVVVDKTRKGKLDQELNEQERATFRTVLMKLMWVSRQCRPELLGTCTILSSKVTVATIRDLLELGKLVSHLLSTPNLGLTIHPIDMREARLVVVADASPSGLMGESAQSGVLIGLTTEKLDQGLHAPVSWLLWRAGKITRKCSSSLAAEAYALVQGVAMAEWVLQTMAEFSNQRFDTTWYRKRLMAWNRGEVLDLNGVMLVRDQVAEALRRHLIITDAKSLFDSIKCDAGSKGKEPRISLATAEAREGMSMLGLKPRWCPHNAMPVDSLTKVWSKSNGQPLIQSMQSGCFRLAPEETELSARKAEREEVGRNARQKRQ